MKRVMAMAFPPNRMKLSFFLRNIKGFSKKQAKERMDIIEAILAYKSYDPDDWGTSEWEAWELWEEFKEFDNKARHRRGKRINLQQIGKQFGVPYYLIRRALDAYAESKGKTLGDFVTTLGGKYVYIIPRSKYPEFINFVEEYVAKHKSRGKTYAEFLKEMAINGGKV